MEARINGNLGDIIQTALKRVLVQASDAPLEPDEYQDALDSLNDLMAAYGRTVSAWVTRRLIMSRMR